MYLVRSCLLRKKSYNIFEQIKCLMSLNSHQFNHTRNLVSLFKCFHVIRIKLELLDFSVPHFFMEEMFLTGKNRTFYIF